MEQEPKKSLAGIQKMLDEGLLSQEECESLKASAIAEARASAAPAANETLERTLPAELPQGRTSLLVEFWDFIRYNKAWWMTPIILVLALMVAFILFAETSPVLPFIYTVI